MAATGTTLPSALPYVSWSTLTIAVVQMADWPVVFSSMQALKGHVQEYPGCQKLEAFVHTEPDGAIRIHCYTTELAGPSTFFFVLLSLILAGWGVVMIVGHLVWGQKF